MKPQEIDELAGATAEKVIQIMLARGLVSFKAPVGVELQPSNVAPLFVPHRLTVQQFAICIGKCDQVVRRRIHERFIEKAHVFGPPYLIDRAALAKFKVTMEVAAERLSQAAARAAAVPPAIPTPELQQSAA